MPLMLTRMLAYFTLFSYLVLGTVAVRFFTPAELQVSFSASYLMALQETNISEELKSNLESPEISFSRIEIPVERKIATVVKPQVKKTFMVRQPVLKNVFVSKNELPFQETISLNAIYFENQLNANNLAMYKDVLIEDTKIASTEATPVQPVIDSVSTTMASSEEVEPEFFEYPVEKNEKEVKSEVSNVSNKVEVSADKEVIREEIAIADSAPSTVGPEEISVNDLVAFDYSQVKQDIAAKKVPTVSTQSHSIKPIDQTSTSSLLTSQDIKSEELPKVKSVSHPVEVTIQVTGINLKNVEKLNNYQVRFQDDSSEIGDIGSGDVVIKEGLSSTKSTRSLVVLKPGYIPTNTDLILSDDFYDLSIPLIEEGVFNQEIESFENGGPVGAVLVELDDDTELAQLDVPFGKVVLLDGDLKITERDDFRYQLFIGVKAGNALLSYKTDKNTAVKKIIHIHERELTFDSNFYEEMASNVVKLYEEDLLAKEKSPLIVASNSVRIFASKETAVKVANNSYKLNFDRGHLGGRRYLELNHQNESVFIGFRESQTVTMPSESLRNYIESYKTVGSCLVQVNLKKKTLNIDVGSESVESSLMLNVQMLDMDGKFYDTVSEKTRKVIIVGESQGAGGVSPDGKINVKIDYLDGTSDYLSTYCSPDTYLVEQL